MKKILSIFLTGVLIFSIAACAGASETADGTTELSDGSAAETGTAGLESAAEGTEDSQDTGVLVVYFSWADNAILAEDVDAVSSPSVIPPGNVQQLADWVQEATGGDLFSIRVTDPYPSDWDACLERANEERGENARPELAESVENLDQYDTVFLGYPNWWYGVPMALLSFLEQNDLSGKQVYLFCSHGTADTSVRRMAVQFDESTVIYELNDGTAADSLYEQLPLTIEVEDYSTNEKIFYPPQALDISDSPQAQAGAGTLAYYEPWGDVVFFYDDYNENPSLFELGQAVSGGELIGSMSGTVTLEAAE